MQRLFGVPRDDGEFLVCGLLPRAEFFARYAAAAGIEINLDTIRYYEILNAWKCIIINNGTACRAARESQSHQDMVLTWVAFSSAVFMDQIGQLLRHQRS